MRPLYEISDEILELWINPYFGAVPYIKAMRWLRDRHSMYLLDTGKSIIRYALGNMQTFRDPEARRIKAELKAHLDEQ